MTWIQIKNKSIHKERIYLIAIFVVLFGGIADEIFGRCHGPIWRIDNYNSLCADVISIQATVGTLVIAILSLIAGRMDKGYLGVKHIDFLFRIKPTVFKQKWIIIAELVLIPVNLFILMKECLNVVIAVFIISIILVFISIAEVYDTFTGIEDVEKEIQAYISSLKKREEHRKQKKQPNKLKKHHTKLIYKILSSYKQKQDIRSKRRTSKEALNRLESLSLQWNTCIASQSDSEYENYSKYFSLLFSLAFSTDNGRQILLRQCVDLSRTLFLTHNENSTVRGIHFVESCYEDEWLCLRDWKRTTGVDSSVEFNLFGEISDDLIIALNESNVKIIEKNFRWQRLVNNIIQNNLWFYAYKSIEKNADKESLKDTDDESNIDSDSSEAKTRIKTMNPFSIPDIKAIYDFCFYLGKYISSFRGTTGTEAINKDLWGYPLSIHMKSLLSFPDNPEVDYDQVADKAVAECYFNFMIAQASRGYYEIIDEYWYRDLGNNNFGDLTNNFAYIALKLHCYIYYLAYYETEKCVSQAVIDAAREFLSRNSVKASFGSFVINLASDDKNVFPNWGRHRYDLFNSSLDRRLFADLRSYEFLPRNAVKRMVMDDVTQDFVAFLSSHIGNSLHDYDILYSIISEERAPSFYIRYERDFHKECSEHMEHFFELMLIDKGEKIQTDKGYSNDSYKQYIATRSQAAYEELLNVIEEKYKNYSLQDAKNRFKFSDSEYEKQIEEASSNLLTYLNDKFSGLVSEHIREDHGGNVFRRNGYSNINILRFSVLSDDNIERLIKDHYDLLFIRLVNSLANQLHNADYADRIRKEKYSDDEWLGFLRENQDKVVIGSSFVLNSGDYNNYHEIREWLDSTEHYTSGVYGDAILIRKGSVKLNFRNVRIDIHPETIEEAIGNSEPDPKSGKYTYAPSSDMPVEFTRDELTAYLKDNRRTVNVSLEVGVDVDPGENKKIGYIIEPEQKNFS